MYRNESKEVSAEMQLKAIELLNLSLVAPAVPGANLTQFHFNINVESRIDEPNKLVMVIVHLEIKNDNQSQGLGAIAVSCIFEINNFSQVISKQANGMFSIPTGLVAHMNDIAISTCRGVMFSSFKGTFLHNAVLPIIDPNQFQAGQGMR